MKLHIITPQYVVFEGEVESVAVPGKNGEFQMLNNHAPIVSSLDEGIIKIRLKSQGENIGKLTKSSSDASLYLFEVTGGVVEMSNNIVTILAN